MYLARKIDKIFIDWKKDTDRLPLIVKGARQIGKTESILNFAKTNYKNVIYINFVENSQYKNITRDGYAATDIIKNISDINPRFSFIPNETIIIFDEIQAFPDITTSLKFFALYKKYDVICSGSLLGIHYKAIESISVGYKTEVEMFGFDFEEYLWALSYKQNQIDDMLLHMIDLKPYNENEIKIYKKHFLDFCTLGGMPYVIKTYIEQNTFEKLDEIQNQLVVDYENDIKKYDEGLNQSKIIRVFRSIPMQLAKDNKKFQFSKIGKNVRSRDYDGCIEWLLDAGIINKCNIIKNLHFPLKSNVEENNFKIYYHDTGLLLSQYDEWTKEDIRINKNIGIFKGAIYENIGSEALSKQKYELYCFKKEDSQIEIDFVIRHKEDVIPIEIKAGNNRAKSLTTLLKDKHFDNIKYGFKFSDQNIGINENIYTFPMWNLFLLRRYMRDFKNK